MAATRSVFLIFCLRVICFLFGYAVPSVVAASRNLWLDCPCIYATEVDANNSGTFSVNSSNARFSRSDCVLIFVMGASNNIVQLELKDVHLQPNCIEYVELFPYLKEPVIENSTVPEYTICHSQFKRNVSLNYAPEELNEIVSQLDVMDHQQEIEEVDTSATDGQNHQHHQHQQQQQRQWKQHPYSEADLDPQFQQQQLFSGGRIYGLRVIFKPTTMPRDDNSSVALYIQGKYSFLDKANFTNDGRLIPGTYCDYYFFAEEKQQQQQQQEQHQQQQQQQQQDQQQRPANETVDAWKYFHSPRYPANYAAHIQCSYKFIGRPDTRVEVVFMELSLPKKQENCNLDKVTIYDAESPNVSSIIDVICETVHNKRVFSNGPDLLIEFNASSNQTAKGFRGKFKFVDATRFKKERTVIANPKLNEVLFHETHALAHTDTASGSNSLTSPLVNPAGIHYTRTPTRA